MPGWSIFALRVYLVLLKHLTLQIVNHALSLISSLGVTLAISLKMLIFVGLTNRYRIYNTEESVTAANRMNC